MKQEQRGQCKAITVKDERCKNKAKMNWLCWLHLQLEIRGLQEQERRYTHREALRRYLSER